MGSKDTLFSAKPTINCRGRLVDFSVPRIMGVINTTPDSFFDGSRYSSAKEVCVRIEAMLSEGADIIDIGAYSSRPGARDIGEDEEIKRLDSVLEDVRKRFPDTILSIDTFRSSVAEHVVREFGVDMINDISAGEQDERMMKLLGELGIPYIIMHMRGTPQTMQDNPVYTDPVKELLEYFAQRIDIARRAGIMDLIVDPGFGFGKTISHNFELLSGIAVFHMLGVPVMAGLSRKSMIYKTLGIMPGEALNGTTVLNTLALVNGVNILRVHDVKEAVQAVKLYLKYLEAGKNKEIL
jgi:dihydropteroate synthase